MRSVCRKMKAESKQLGACFSRLHAHTHLKPYFIRQAHKNIPERKSRGSWIVPTRNAVLPAVCNGNKDASATLVLPNSTP